MRIAVSGTHRSGKSTLIAELSRLLPSYETVDEPYHLMLEDGFEFGHPPSLEDFTAQLERSLDALSDGRLDVLYDRCPVDFLGYILTHEDAAAFDLEGWLPRIQAAMGTLDLVVFLAIAPHDPIAFTPSDDDAESREAVDEKLKELLLEDSLGIGVDVLEVAGDVSRRARTVLQRLRTGR